MATGFHQQQRQVTQMNEGEVSNIYTNIVQNIDTEVPDNVVILNMLDTDDKAETFFGQVNKVAGFNGRNGFAVWNIANGGTYWVFYQMTAGDPRPLYLSSNDKLLSNIICNDVTGSWANEGAQWFHYGPFELEGSMKLDTDGYWPHVRRFLLVPTAAAPVLSRTIPMSKSDPDIEPELLQLSHAQVAESLASIPNRPSDKLQNYMTALRQPKSMSDNVNVSGSMIVVIGGTGYYEFEFVNEAFAEEVYLDVSYASGDCRPVDFSLNGSDVVELGCCGDETGGYGVENFINIRAGPFPVDTEVNTIKVTATNGFFPHLGEIRVVDVQTASDKTTERSQGTWIVPPSSPLDPDLPPLDFCFIENTQEPNPGFVPDPNFYNGINLDGFWVLTSKEVDKRVLNQAAELMCR